jgi:hypothetical protein
MQPFIKYASLFKDYSLTSVWQSPEVLAQNRLQEFNKPMDVYSFAIIMW